MKTAISIPDSLFDEAEALAQRLGVSRSELFARATAEFVRAHRRSDITERLNRVYGRHASGLDPVLQRLQDASIPRDEW
jgi:metal-responsive CopG/Arc/MetJ family transcriptional regulator